MIIRLDIGANLTDEVFQGVYRGKQIHPPDLKVVLDRAFLHGIDRIMITSGMKEDIPIAMSIVDQYREHQVKLSTTIGIHPTRCLEFERDPSLLDQLKEKLKCDGKYFAAIGEFGLDYDRLEFCPKDIQLK